ncbi:MAG TPA: hypothetical protein VIB99_05395 [Candidatus Limnocylindrales bacterium]
MPANEPIRLTPTGGRGRPTIVAGAIVALLLLGLIKPWGGGTPTTGILAPTSPARPVAIIPSPAATGVAASLDPHGNTTGPCYYGQAWRLFTTETSDVGPIHTWYGLLPVAASGPADPRIRTIRIHSSTIGQLGYCGLSDPVQVRILSTQAWRIGPGGVPQALALDPVRDGAPGGLLPAADAGAIYTAPDSATWTPALYVFGVRLATSPASEEWFAVDIA